MFHIRRVFFVCVLFIINFEGFSQESLSIRFLVLDEATLQGIAGVEIQGDQQLLGTSDQEGRLEVQSAATFTTIRFVKDGYQLKEMPFNPDSPSMIVSLAMSKPKVRISGLVVDQGELLPLTDCHILLGKDSIAKTDSDGRFSLELDRDLPVSLEFRQPGYEIASQTITQENRLNLVVKLPLPVSQTPEIIRVFGTVTAGEKQKTLRNASVIVKGLVLNDRQVGTTTDGQGNFRIFARHALPMTLVVSYVGYEAQEITINQRLVTELSINLEKEALKLEEVVIRSAKIEQEILKSDITVEQLNIKQIQYSPSFDFYDAIASMKDVEVATQGMQNQSVNSRGFNSTGNTRFVQMVDGMDNQAPGFGFPIGNFAGLSELDIEGVELLPGPSSARYGPNAFNGILFMRSKDPFLYQGLSGYMKLAANRFPEGGGGSSFFDVGGKPVIDLGFRYAHSVNDKLGFKTTFGVIKAVDWEANNFDNIGAGERFERHPEAPGYDGINIYGDEIKAELPIGLGGINQTVTRTGYQEGQLLDYRFTNIKANAAIHYRIGDNMTAIVEGNYGRGNTVYTGNNRVFLGDFQLFQGKVELSGFQYGIRAYTTQQVSGKSYDSRFLALQIMRAAKSDQEWFRDYELAYKGLLVGNGIPGSDHEAARNAADSDLSLREQNYNRFEPGTPEYDSLRTKFINTIGFDQGAGFNDNSSLYHVNAWYNFSELLSFMELEIGGNYRLYDPDSEGNIFPDSTGNDITMSEFGGFIEAARELLVNTKFTASVRVDKNENFDTRITPRLSATYNKDAHNFRASVQTGFRNPTIREQFSYQNLGAAFTIGGLEPLIQPLDLAGNSFFEQTVESFNQAVRELTTPDQDGDEITWNQEQAELENLGILQAGILGSNDVSPLKPEKVNTIEIGYRSLLADNKLVLDVNYYYNWYRDFIGILRVIKPKTSPATDLFLAARQMNNTSERDFFFIYGNAKETIISQGLSFNLDYTSTGGFIMGLNGTWANLVSESTDPIVPGFNTPNFKLNYTLGHNEITDNLRFKAILRTRRPFQWESNFGDGEVEAYYNLDIQLNLRIPKIHSMLKMGMSNLGNEYYANTFGGPRIGSLPYVQITYDPVFY